MIDRLRRCSGVFAFALACVLSACSGAYQQSALPARAHAMDSTASTPGDSAGSLPGDSAGSLPGDSAGSLPGAQLACSPTQQSGNTSCTIAININVPALNDPTAPASEIPGLHPADLQSRYALPAQNAGGTVAIVDAYDDPTAESDLAVYRLAFGLPACSTSNGCFRKVNQNGAASAYPAANAAWAQEISLDLDMVSAVCPKCKILLVEANSSSIDNLGAGVDEAVRLGAVAVSNSYYTTEWPSESSYDVHYDHPGVAVTVSAGDQPQPFYPAASPYVTSVGGTSLSGGSGSWNETAWAYGGRGCSAYEKKPSWQNSSDGCSGMRSTVDVAAIADPQTGVAMYDSASGGWLVAGGTSVGAPLVAAAYALSANPASPQFSYAHSGAFFDIPPAGYDLATGLGSPDGVAGL